MVVEQAQGEAHEEREEREYIFSPAVSSPSQRWKVSRASSHKTRRLYTSVPLLLQQYHKSSLTIVIMTNQYRVSADNPLCAALEFSDTEPADGPVKVSSPGLSLHFTLHL